MVYQETPQPSLPNFNYPSQAAAYGYLAGQIVGNSGHLRVTVTGTGLQVDYVRAYLPTQESATRHNKDISATYSIGLSNCYNLSSNSAVIWNSNYADEITYPNPFSKETTIAFNLNYLTEEKYLLMKNKYIETSKQLSGFSKYLKSFKNK